jgi:hypothetical protein
MLAFKVAALAFFSKWFKIHFFSNAKDWFASPPFYFV